MHEELADILKKIDAEAKLDDFKEGKARHYIRNMDQDSVDDLAFAITELN